MRLIDVVQGPWAITPKMLDEIQGIYLTHLRGEKIDIEKVEMRLGRPMNNSQAEYDVQDGVAILNLEGVVGKKMNLFTQISGGISTQMVAAQLQQAVDDPMVDSILLVIDSPGGTVDGTQELVNTIYSLRGQKPIVALADGLMASAGYWIGSAADKIFASSDTTEIGSIGVAAQHIDTSARDAQNGIKRTDIYAGKYKRIATGNAPLSAEGANYLQDSVDNLYTIFVDSVARNRGTTSETVLKDMADGRVFLAQEAVKRGLVDGVATQSELMARMAAGEFAATPVTTAQSPGVGPQAKTNEEANMADKLTVEKLRADHPEVAKAIFDEGKSAGVEEGRTLGAGAERERIQSVLAQDMPGHSALVQSLAFDGKTTGPEAAVQVLAAEKKARTNARTNIEADAQDIRVPTAGAGADTVNQKKPGAEGKSGGHDANDLARRAAAYQAEQAKLGNKITTAEAVAHCMTEGQ